VALHFLMICIRHCSVLLVLPFVLHCDTSRSYSVHMVEVMAHNAWWISMGACVWSYFTQSWCFIYIYMVPQKTTRMSTLKISRLLHFNLYIFKKK
jgi:predicted MFS family arabinose efflux permease